jgi:hypothetical protein
LSLAACFETGKKWQQAVFFKIQASTGLLPRANLAQLGSNFQLKYLTIIFFSGVLWELDYIFGIFWNRLKILWNFGAL